MGRYHGLAPHPPRRRLPPPRVEFSAPLKQRAHGSPPSTGQESCRPARPSRETPGCVVSGPARPQSQRLKCASTTSNQDSCGISQRMVVHEAIRPSRAAPAAAAQPAAATRRAGSNSRKCGSPLSPEFPKFFARSRLVPVVARWPKRPTDPVLSLFCLISELVAGDPSVDTARPHMTHPAGCRRQRAPTPAIGAGKSQLYDARIIQGSRAPLSLSNRCASGC